MFLADGKEVELYCHNNKSSKESQGCKLWLHESVVAVVDKGKVYASRVVCQKRVGNQENPVNPNKKFFEENLS